MKKTLVALAVLAASGASFAQVTITGNLAMGYRATTTGGATAADAAGFGVDTSEIDFAATEDLGGGMKATAKLALAGADRSGESNATTAGGVTGRDASLTLTTSVGAFQLASVQAADYLSGGLAGVGAYYNGFDGKVLSARSNRDVVNYILPIGTAWTLALTYQETANVLGLGAGTTGASTATNQSLTGLSASYAAGKLNGNFTYLQFNSPVGGALSTTAGVTLGLATAATKSQTRLSGNYDFGVVKLGAGAVVTNQDAGVAAAPKVTDLLVGVNAPMGALTLGAEWVQRRYDDSTAATLATIGANGTVSGVALQAAYALSKRTSLIGNYARWDAAVGAANASTQYNLLVSHSF